MNTNSKTSLNTRISDGYRFAQLAQMGEVVFSAQDLATIWGIKNRQTLRVTLSRYTRRGLLHRIWKGLYSLRSVQETDARLLGIRALHTYSYISCESILFDAGIINQRPTEITIVSSVSKRFVLNGIHYRSRKMQDALLYDSDGITIANGIMIATPERAKRDMDYFHPKKYYDANF